MPTTSPSKSERLSRLLSRLRSRRSSASSLVVQTGFPTSLADLVVKNRSKFRKRRKPSPPSSASPISESVESGADTDDSLASAVETPVRIDRETGPMRVELGLRFLMVKMVALVVLVVGRRWVVAGITILAFALLVLERLRFNLKARLNAADGFDLRGMRLVSPMREAEDHQSRDLDLRGLELVSPIREIESVDHRNSLQTERVSDAFAVSKVNSGDLDLRSEIIQNQNLGISRESKKKRIFRKLFKRKKCEKRDDKGSSSSLDGSRVSSSEEMLLEGEDDGDDEFLSFEACNEVVEIDKEDVNLVGDDWSEIRTRRWKIMVLVLVVLLGLLGGKVSALILTIAWYLILNALEQCRRNGRCIAYIDLCDIFAGFY